MSILDECRDSIEKIDAQMAELFVRRMEESRKIAEYKTEHGISIRDTKREEILLAKNRKLISDQNIESYYVEFMKNVMNLSVDYQSRLMNGMTVAYSGVEGAYAYIMAKKMFPSANLVPYANFNAAYKAAEDGKADCAVLPIENSFAGEVGAVMDLLFSGDLYINQVRSLDIVHNLMAVPGASIDSIKTVVSHPQALDQCEEYIQKHGFQTIAFPNTAVAAKHAKELNDPTVAAIASEETAQLYGLKVLESGINTSRNNTTRFAVFSRAKNSYLQQNKRSDECFIMLLTVRNEALALVQTLNIIGAHGYNMRNLRSRPLKDSLWQYYFYIEAEGNINTPNGQEMLQELKAVCANLKIAGTYYNG